MQDKIPLSQSWEAGRGRVMSWVLALILAFSGVVKCGRLTTIPQQPRALNSQPAPTDEPQKLRPRATGIILLLLALWTFFGLACRFYNLCFWQGRGSCPVRSIRGFCFPA